MTTDIQRARDILKKRREASRSAGPQDHFWTSDIDSSVKYLVMLTAGNPNLLDAIDLFLADPVDLDAAERIAAAIIAADERMSV